MEAILAATSDGGIGLAKGLPWKPIKADFGHFVRVSAGKKMYAAKTTYNSMPPLAPNHNRTLNLYKRKTVLPDDALLIGGKSLFTLAHLRKCKVVWFTQVLAEHKADTYLEPEVLAYLKSNCNFDTLITLTPKCAIYKIVNDIPQ